MMASHSRGRGAGVTSEGERPDTFTESSFLEKLLRYIIVNDLVFFFVVSLYLIRLCLPFQVSEYNGVV